MPGISFQAIFCAEREPNRQWDLPSLDFDHVFLRERFSTVNGRYIHNNPDVIPALSRFKPDVVITDGFNPTHLYAFAYAWLKRLPHVPMTDGTDVSEQGLSALHRAVRRFVYARSTAFVCASRGGQRLYESYGIAAERCFQSCLCIDNDAFSPAFDQQEKRFDFIFSGRIEPVKNPLFALEVARETAKRLQRRVTILFVGAGSEEQKVRSAASLQPELLDVAFHGFAAQRELPALYRSARLFLFPTLWDPWGVVANEACAAGLPVIVSPDAGAAGELVRDGENGFVCPLDAKRWAECAALLLARQDIWQSHSARSQSLAREYSYDNAAAGLLAACRFTLPAGMPGNIRNPV
jgi:glycosyltransferase involved in cell wall biosynthesis